MASSSATSAQGHCASINCNHARTWLQSRRMRETSPASMPTDPSQRALIERAFEVGRAAAARLAQIVPAIDRDRVEYAVAGVLLEEAWVSVR